MFSEAYIYVSHSIQGGGGVFQQAIEQGVCVTWGCVHKNVCPPPPPTGPEAHPIPPRPEAFSDGHCSGRYKSY